MVRATEPLYQIAANLANRVMDDERMLSAIDRVFSHYNAKDDSYIDGYSGEGVVVIAVDNLPTELPRDASVEFSNNLFKFIPAIVNADKSLPFNEVNLPDEIKKAVIVYNGELTEDYSYLNEFLNLS